VRPHDREIDQPDPEEDARQHHEELQEKQQVSIQWEHEHLHAIEYAMKLLNASRFDLRMTNDE
jgi:hypothetical protein